MIITTQKLKDKKTIYALVTTKSHNEYITFDLRLISDLKELATNNKSVRFYPNE